MQHDSGRRVGPCEDRDPGIVQALCHPQHCFIRIFVALASLLRYREPISVGATLHLCRQPVQNRSISGRDLPGPGRKESLKYCQSNVHNSVGSAEKINQVAYLLRLKVELCGRCSHGRETLQGPGVHRRTKKVEEYEIEVLHLV